MKTFLYALSLFFLCLSAQAQTDYIPMLEEGRYWISEYKNFDDMPSVVGAYACQVGGDTLYQGEEYHKIYRYELAGNPCPQPCFSLQVPYTAVDTTLVALMREDPIEKKVYEVPIFPFNLNFDCLVSLNVGEEFVLYDFSLEQGDTLNPCTLAGEVFEPGSGLVDSFGVEEYYGLLRPLIYTTGNVTTGGLAAYDQLKIMQGFGLADRGLLYNYPSYLVDYCSGAGADCEPLLSSSNSTAIDEVDIYPNPVGDVLHVKTDAFSMERIHLYGLDGIEYPLDATAEQFDLSFLSSGLYFLIIEKENGDLLKTRFVKL